MKLEQLKVENFRCFKDEVTIDLGDLVVVVGRNDAGKSSLFDALDIFFEGKAAPDRDDPYIKSDDSTVRITCVFSELPSEILIDAQHTTSLASEYLLNSKGFLEVTKVYNCGLSKPKLLEVEARAIHPTADDYGDLHLLTNARLKARARTLKVDVSVVNQTINSEIRKAIWSHAEDLLTP